MEDIEECVVDRLKERACRNRRSFEDEVRFIMIEAAELSLAECGAIMKHRMEKRFGDRVLSDSSLLIREDRDR